MGEEDFEARSEPVRRALGRTLVGDVSMTIESGPSDGRGDALGCAGTFRKALITAWCYVPEDRLPDHPVLPGVFPAVFLHLSMRFLLGFPLRLSLRIGRGSGPLWAGTRQR